MKTRDEFLERWRHHVGGLLFEAISTIRNGSELSLWTRNAQRKLDSILGEIYGEDVNPIKQAEQKPPEPKPQLKVAQPPVQQKRA